MAKKNKNKNYTFFNFITLIVTFFGSGSIKFCPGTWGSIATLPFWLIINLLLLITGITYSFTGVVFIWFLITIGLFLLGWWASNIYMDKNKKCDPSEIVIDEVVGQLLTYIMTTIAFVVKSSRNTILFFDSFNTTGSIILFLFLMLILPIIFFRIFDISKPWFIGKVDKECKGGFGVMIDDVMAGLVAGILSSICVMELL